MNYTYEFGNAEGTAIKRTDENGRLVFIPTSLGNMDYVKFTQSNAVAAAYVPPAPAVPTALELLIARVAQLEADHATAMNNMNNNGGY